MIWIWNLGVGALAGAANGFLVALALKIGRKEPKIPQWPVVTGALLGLAAGMSAWARNG